MKRLWILFCCFGLVGMGLAKPSRHDVSPSAAVETMPYVEAPRKSYLHGDATQKALETLDACLKRQGAARDATSGLASSLVPAVPSTAY